MAYTTPRTVATGDRAYTASEINAFGANFAVGVPDLFTTKGDLAAATGELAAARLAIGAAGELLHAKSSISNGLDWRKPEYGAGAKQGVGSYANATEETVDIGAPDRFDLDTSLASGSFSYTCRATGYYLICGTVYTAETVQMEENEIVYFRIYNGAAAGQVFAAYISQKQYTNYEGANGAAIIYAASGDVITVKGYQNTGGSAQLFQQFLSIFRIA